MTRIIAWIITLLVVVFFVSVVCAVTPPAIDVVDHTARFGAQEAKRQMPLNTAPVVPAPGAPAPAPAPAPVGGCVQPQTLAGQNGWQVIEWADKKYGGLRVSVPGSAQLPPKWEAIGSGTKVAQDDSSRTIQGVVSIYPPFACRATLGYSQ